MQFFPSLFAELTNMISKFSLQCIQIPKSLKFSSFITVIFDTSISIGVFELVIKWHLSAFPLTKYFINQSDFISIPPLSCPRTDIVSDMEYYHRQSLQNLDHQYRKKRSHMWALNNSAQIIDPWGTPNKISAKELYEEFILVICFLPLR